MTTEATDPSSSVSRKRKRVSKNKKKSWRRHTDVQDVEEHLEDVRLQERTGGLVAEKTDDQLFFVDTVQVKEEATDEVPKKKRRKEPEPLKCHALLEPDPNIKPIRVKHNVRIENNIRKQSLAKRLKQEYGVVSKTQQEATVHRRQARQARREKLRERRKGPKASLYDLWDSKEKTGIEDDHYQKVTKKMRPKVPKNYLQKPSEISAVEVAHAGASYNPTYEDHQALLHKAFEVEVQKAKEEGRITKALDAKFPSMSQASSQEAWLSEMSPGLQSEDKKGESPKAGSQEADDDEEDVGDLGCVAYNPPVRREDKKTERQRRKEKEKLDQTKAASNEKSLRSKKNEILRLKAIKKEVEGQERGLAARAQRKKLRQETLKNQPKKLGKLKFEAPDIEIKLSDELEGSLRTLKPEGHLLEDRFKSLQKRNIIEPRKRAKFVRKYKKKKFDRKGWREIVE